MEFLTELAIQKSVYAPTDIPPPQKGHFSGFRGFPKKGGFLTFLGKSREKWTRVGGGAGMSVALRLVAPNEGQRHWLVKVIPHMTLESPGTQAHPHLDALPPPALPKSPSKGAFNRL